MEVNKRGYTEIYSIVNDVSSDITTLVKNTRYQYLTDLFPRELARIIFEYTDDDIHDDFADIMNHVIQRQIDTSYDLLSLFNRVQELGERMDKYYHELIEMKGNGNRSKFIRL